VGTLVGEAVERAGIGCHLRLLVVASVLAACCDVAAPRADSPLLAYAPPYFPTARLASLAGAGVALPTDDPFAADLNPALLAGLQGLTWSHSRHSDGVAWVPRDTTTGRLLPLTKLGEASETLDAVALAIGGRSVTTRSASRLAGRSGTSWSTSVAGCPAWTTGSR